MATFLEIAAHSVDHMFSLNFEYLSYNLFPVLVLRAGGLELIFAYFLLLFGDDSSSACCLE